MRRFRPLMAAATLFIACGSAETHLPAPEPEMRSGAPRAVALQSEILVRARVVKVEKRQDGENLTCRIEHVYVGERQLGIENHFTVFVFIDHPPWFIPRNANIIIIESEFIRNWGAAVGEAGIWQLEFRDGKLSAIPYLRHQGKAYFGTIRLPARKTGINPKFEAAAELAQAVERVAAAQPERQHQLLRQYARSANLELSCWAIHVLDQTQEPGNRDYLRGLAERADVPLRAQAVLDEVLCRSSPAWRGSPERQKLRERWVELEALVHWDAGYAETRLTTALREDRDYAGYLQLVEKAIAALHRANDPSEASWWRKVVTVEARELDRDGETFRFLVERLQLKPGPEADRLNPTLRFSLAQLTPLSPEQLQRVQTLRAACTDAPTNRALDKIILWTLDPQVRPANVQLD